jgi:hypothetical protein
MRCPDRHKTIGRFTVDSPPLCPLTGRVVELPTTRWRESELVWGCWRPINV